MLRQSMINKVRRTSRRQNRPPPLIAERGGKIALYMPHSYVAPHKQATPDNVQKNSDYYVKLGNDLNALVIPVGLAFAEAYKRDPALKLHKSYDGSHPSRAGSYLAAATVYAALYNRSPVGNKFDAFDEVDTKNKIDPSASCLGYSQKVLRSIKKTPPKKVAF